MKTPAFLAIIFFCFLAQAHIGNMSYQHKPALVDLNTLKALNFPILAKDETARVGYTVLTPEMEMRLSRVNHAMGRCAGFEALSEDYLSQPQKIFTEFALLKNLVSAEQKYSNLSFRSLNIVKNPSIEAALSEVSEQNLKDWVTWFSSYPTRFNRAATANDHVMALKAKLEALMKDSPLPWDVSTIDHTSTPQKSLRVRITGSKYPNEIIALGAHFDSISGYFGGTTPAPGADDNASGSSNIIEVLRIISKKAQPERTIEFFWYAGEESGLLGSAEIAKSYKQSNKDVVAVLQLDMTLFPGDGPLSVGNMQDFTSVWLRDFLVEMNKVYNMNLNLIADECGYGCSDHASWYRQGYPTLMPFEATMNTMNHQIHTANDRIDANSNFAHSAAFSKIALVFALDLANSRLRQTYGDSAQ